jgi:hypothetical protein
MPGGRVGDDRGERVVIAVASAQAAIETLRDRRRLGFPTPGRTQKRYSAAFE